MEAGRHRSRCRPDPGPERRSSTPLTEGLSPDRQNRSNASRQACLVGEGQAAATPRMMDDRRSTSARERLEWPGPPRPSPPPHILLLLLLLCCLLLFQQAFEAMRWASNHSTHPTLHKTKTHTEMQGAAAVGVAEGGGRILRRRRRSRGMRAVASSLPLLLLALLLVVLSR
jgi:hypothetical protein